MAHFSTREWSDADEWEYQGFDEMYRQLDEEYRRKQAWKLAEIEDTYTRKLAEIDAYYAAEFARVEAAYGLGEIPEDELVALRYELTESARLDRERWGY